MPVLTPGTIYAALYWRPDGKYHWAIIVADDSASGQKLHATNLESPAWQYAIDSFAVATERKPLVILAQIGEFTQSSCWIHGDTRSVIQILTITNPRKDEVRRGECEYRPPLVWGTTGDARMRLIASIHTDGDNILVGRQWKVYDDLGSVQL